MRIILLFLFIITITSCADNNEKKTSIDLQETSLPNEDISDLKIDFNNSLVSKYSIESQETINTKAIEKRLSEYSIEELEKLPESKRLNLSIVVPNDISKLQLINTLKSIVAEKSAFDNDIDEILIFAYDEKDDIGKIEFTFGKLLWSPKGKTGNVTGQIAKFNMRKTYDFDIIIKEKVGEIKLADIPTSREFEIYKTIMADENIGLEEEKLNKMIMKKFGIKTSEEVDAIWLKVAAYKN